ncbi:hypothetical protein Q4S26_24130, partial [Morganella morganii]
MPLISCAFRRSRPFRAATLLRPFTLACLLLGAGLAAPPQWRYLAAGRSDASDIRQWWKAFGAPELDSLLQRALLNSQDLGAAVARVRQAQASAVIAGAPLLPELNAT